MSSTATAHRFLAARPTPGAAVDVAIAALAFAGTLALIRHGGVAPTSAGSAGLDPIGVVLAACSALPLVAWRRSPFGVFAATTAAAVLMAALGYPLDLIPGPTAALYLLAASRDRDAPWTGRGTAAVVALFLAYLVATAAASGTFPAIAFLHTGLSWALAWFAGDRTRLRREQVVDLRQRAVRAEREADRERLLAIAEERARIARDLHDSAGHAISVIAVRAGAARLRHHQDPDRSLAALQAVEELARQTVTEIDQIVGTLRDGGPADDDVQAPAGLASLDTLIAYHASAGREITVDASGVPRTLGGAADQAAYRILQEALTNAARHGTGATRLELAFGDAAVELTVTNPVSTGAAARRGGGHGLIGMRERASLLGGSLDAGRVDGTFRVRARIPYGGHRP